MAKRQVTFAVGEVRLGYFKCVGGEERVFAVGEVRLGYSIRVGREEMGVYVGETVKIVIRLRLLWEK